MNIECKHISIDLKNKTVIDCLNYEQNSTELVGLIGPNGAGKTTFIRALAGIQPLNSGSIRIDGINPFTQQQVLAKKVAYLPQQRVLHWTLTVFEVVMLGRLPHLNTFQPPDKKDHSIAENAIRNMDIEHLSKRQFHELSGGEQARVLIARALTQQPQLLLADEPVNGLDPAHQISLMKTFRRVVDEGCTVITSMHDLNLAARYCDRILLLHSGQIELNDITSEVINPETISRYFDVEVDIQTLKGALSVSVIDNANK